MFIYNQPDLNKTFRLAQNSDSHLCEELSE